VEHLPHRGKSAAHRLSVAAAAAPCWLWCAAALPFAFHETLSGIEFAVLLLSLVLVIALARLDSYIIRIMTGRPPQEWGGVFDALMVWRRSGEPAPVWLVQAIAWPIVLCALVLGFSLMYAPSWLPGGLGGWLLAKLEGPGWTGD
jgi:hypothetical protein